MAGAGADYYGRISNLEGRSKQILDSLIDTLERGEKARDAVRKFGEIEMRAAELAQVEGKDELELNERNVLLEKLGGDLAEAAEYLPDAMIAASQDEIVEAMEGAISGLHAARNEFKRAGGEDSADAQRKLKTKAAVRVDESEKTIELIGMLIDRRPHVPDHPVAKAHERARISLARAVAGVGRKNEHLKRERLTLHATKLREEMKTVLQKQLEGRIFVDSKKVQIRSSVTGQVHEWEMDDSAAYALEDLVGGGTLASILPRVMEGKAHLASKFTCKNIGGSLHVELDAGERTIVGDSIVFKGHKAKIEP